MHLRVFVSHASEDKDRFVLPFAKRLRQAGVDAWVDRWEMLPGDSLVDKIFEEGLKDAQAVIVVLSQASVAKPWVREEINSAFVSRIQRGTRLIPVVLGDCEVPQALQSTLWERISNLDSYDESFDRILGSIAGVRKKPPLGTLPSHLTTPALEIPGLATIDSLVLTAICEAALREGHEIVQDPALRQGPLASLPEQELRDSLDMLEDAGMVTLTRFLGGELPIVHCTTLGFQQYARTNIPDYDLAVQAIAAAIANEGLNTNKEIQKRLGREVFFINHALDLLERQNFIQTSKFIGGTIRVVGVSASLRRALEG